MGNVKDLNESAAIITKLSKLTKIGGVEFLAYDRKEGTGATNKNILIWLKEQGRNYMDFTEKDLEIVDKSFMKEFNRRFAKIKNKPAQQLEKNLRSVFVSALRAAIFSMIEIIQQRILKEIDFEGRAVEPLSEAYKKLKMKKFGHDAIGIATGQLLDNLNQDNKNVRIIKG